MLLRSNGRPTTQLRAQDRAQGVENECEVGTYPCLSQTGVSSTSHLRRGCKRKVEERHTFSPKASYENREGGPPTLGEGEAKEKPASSFQSASSFKGARFGELRGVRFIYKSSRSNFTLE